MSKSEYRVGDVVEYTPGPGLSNTASSSLGFVPAVKEDFYIQVHWYVENILPVARGSGDDEWIAAGILEQIGKLKIISKQENR